MKNNKIASAALIAAFVLTGCARMDENYIGNTKQVSFNASFEETTRTECVDSIDVFKVNWCSGDTIRFFSREDGTVGTYTVTESSSYTVLEADVAENDKYFVAEYGGTGIKENNDTSFTITGASMAEQDGKFSTAHVSVARTTDLESTKLTFKNITSLIKFDIERNDIAYMTFTSTDDTKIQGNGDIIVSFDGDGNPVGRFNEAKAGTSVKIITNGPGTYYIATLPTVLASGFRCDFYAADGKKLGIATGEKPLTIGKNDIVNLGTLDPHIAPGPENLSVEETANCYIVDKVGDFQFKATVKGNGKGNNADIANAAKAAVLWKSNLTSYSPGEDGIIKDVRFDNGYISFTSTSSGDAVIAAMDADNNILWSWHIWVCLGYDAYAQGQVYLDKYGQKICRMMDRNLGALSANKEDFILTHGLLYEWGRKDPFTTESQYNSAYGFYGPKKETSETIGTVEYVTAHPLEFVYGNKASDFDWLYSDHNATLWDSDKTMYDPCPPGWRIPDEDVFTRALKHESAYSAGMYDNELYGVELGGLLGIGQSVWYPGAGYFDPSNEGKHQYFCRYGLYWTNATKSNNSGMLMLQFSQYIYPKSFSSRSFGASVRCVAIKTEPDPIPVESIILNKHELTLKINISETLTYNSTPENATTNSVDWSSSNPNVATVNSTGTVTAISSGDCWIKAISPDGPKDSCHVIVPEASTTDLSAKESANCYVINTPGIYTFKAVKGNSNTSLTGSVTAETLWESFGNDIRPYPGDLLRNINYSNGVISFTVPANMKDGNAVIALKDASGDILWSWHIWICKGYVIEDNEQQYGNGAILMDRNLGALSGEKGNPLGIGLLYQWGRKDPFLSVRSFYSNLAPLTSADGMFNIVGSSSTTGTVDYSISNPTNFLTSNTDWDNAQKTDKWASDKTIYDPCPAGWRVPDGGYYGVWTANYINKTGNESTLLEHLGYWDNSKCGFEMGEIMGCSESVWYPATAYKFYREGNLAGEGQYSMYWSCTPVGKECYVLYNNVDNITLMNMSKRATGAAVRCQKVGTFTAHPVEKITLSKESIELTVGSTATLSATVYPANASVKKVVWVSSEPEYVTVDNNGKVTGVTASVDITEPYIEARSIDGSVVSTCYVTIK